MQFDSKSTVSVTEGNQEPQKPTKREGKTGWFKGVLMTETIPQNAPADIKRRVLDALNAKDALTAKELVAIDELEGGAFIRDVQEELGMEPKSMNALLMRVADETRRILGNQPE